MCVTHISYSLPCQFPSCAWLLRSVPNVRSNLEHFVVTAAALETPIAAAADNDRLKSVVHASWFCVESVSD